jgi:hypothetical protein
MSIRAIHVNSCHSCQFVSFMSIRVIPVMCHLTFVGDSVKWVKGGVKYVFLGLPRQLRCQAKGKNVFTSVD